LKKHNELRENLAKKRLQYTDEAMELLKDLRRDDLESRARDVALPRFTAYNVGELKQALADREALFKICKEESSHSVRKKISNRLLFTPYGTFVLIILSKLFTILI
jgi:hypothetical protein